MKWQASFSRVVTATLVGLFMATGLAAAGDAPGQRVPLRIGLTPVFLDDQPRILQAWRTYLERQLGQAVHFVQRGSYREISDLLLRGDLEAAQRAFAQAVRWQPEAADFGPPLGRGVGMSGPAGVGLV